MPLHFNFSLSVRYFIISHQIQTYRPSHYLCPLLFVSSIHEWEYLCLPFCILCFQETMHQGGCFRDTDSHRQTAKRGRSLKTELEKLLVILSSFIIFELTEVSQTDLLLIRAISGHFISFFFLSFLIVYTIIMTDIKNVYYLELVAWILVDKAQHL